MATFEERWAAEVESDPEWATLPPKEKQALARVFAQRIARQEVPGNHPRMRAFIERHVAPPPKFSRPDTKSAFGEGLREGFAQSAVGMAARGQLPEPGLGPIEAAGQILSGANPLIGEGAMRGAVGAVGAMAGQAPDVLLGAGAGMAAAKGLARAGVSALPAAVGASVGTGAAIPGAAVKLAGGTNEQAGTAAALGAAGGLLPLAGRVPVGRLNPDVASPIKNAAAARAASKYRIAPPALPAGPPVRTLPPGPPPVTETGLVPVGPPRSTINVPPGGFRPAEPIRRVQQFSRGAIEDQAGPHPAPGRPRPLALPPGKGLERPLAPEVVEEAMRRNAAAYAGQNLVERTPGGAIMLPGELPPPGEFVPPSSIVDAVYPATDLPLGLPPAGRLPDVVEAGGGPVGAARDRLMYGQLGQRPGVMAKGAALDAPLGTPPAAGLPTSLDATVPPPVGQLDLGLGIPAPNPKGKKSPKGRAPIKGAVRRVFDDEDGELRPQEILDALDAAMEFTGSAVRRGYGAAKQGVQAAARAAGPIAQRIGDFEAIPRLGVERLANAAGARRVFDPLERGRQAVMSQRASTPFPALNTALDKTRGFLFSDFGVPQAVKDLDREAKGFARELVAPTRRLALDLDQRLTSAQQADAHMQASEPTYRGPIGPDAQAAQADSRRVSAELLRLEALDPTAHKRWDGFYVGPREYAKHLLSKGTKPPIGVRGRESRSMAGYLGRGTEETMSQATLAKRRAAGEDWKVEHTYPDGRVRAWRDYTIDERTKWGEIRHLSRSLDKRATAAEAEARSAYILDRLAQPGVGDHLGRFAEPASAHVPKGQTPPPELVINGQRYIYLGADRARRVGGATMFVPKTSKRVKKWGRLADHYVREDVYPYLANRFEWKPVIEAINRFTLDPLWKKFVTIGNPPGYFINNLMAQQPMLEVFGGSIFDLPQAAAMLADDAPLVQQMRAGGWLQADALAAELGARVRDAGISTKAPHSGFSLAKMISRAADDLGAYEREAYAVANATDDMYRVALVDGLRRRHGKSFDEAVKIAEDAFYNPERVTAPAAQMATIAAPFARVFWYLSHVLPMAATTNPAKASLMYGTAAMMPYLLNKLMSKSDEQHDAEMAALPPHMRGTGNAAPVGWNEDGTPRYLDKSNWNPGGPMDSNPNVGLPWPLSARGLGVGGLKGILGQLWAGKDLFTGQDLQKKDLHGNVIEDNRGDFLRRNALPGVARNLGGLADAAQGKTTARGNRVTVGDAALRTVGIKVNPVDVEEVAGREAGVADADRREYSRKIARRYRLAEKARAAGDEATAQQLEAEAADLTQKRLEMLKAASERLRTLQGGTPAPTPAPASAGASFSVDQPARAEVSTTAAPVEPGNIDLARRPRVRNADGSISTVRSISIGTNRGTYLIPTVIGNRVVSDEEAIAHFRRTGQHLGLFRSDREADLYAEQLHRDQERMYTPAGRAPTVRR